MAKRRAKGDGGIFQRHDHASCPALRDGVRPQHKCRGRWTAVVDLSCPGEPRRRKTLYGHSKAEVQVKLKQTIRDRDAGVAVLSSATMEKWLRYWLDVICVERGLKVNTLKSHRSKIEQYLIPAIGKHRVDRLQPEHLRAMYAGMRDRGLSEATLRQTHAILHRALKVAVRERKAAVNVAELLDPPKTDKAKRSPLSLEDTRKVLRVGGLRQYVALYLGIRQGEALGLRWCDVNMDDGYLSIEQTLVREPGVGLVFDTPKSRASVRPVPLPTVVLSRFRVAWAEHVATAHPRGLAQPCACLVFSDNGKPLDHRKDWQQWKDLLASVGVQHVALHAARNTTASLLEAVGVPARVVAEILGQSTVTVTYGYQQADLERRGQGLTALESYLDAD